MKRKQIEWRDKEENKDKKKSGEKLLSSTTNRQHRHTQIEQPIKEDKLHFHWLHARLRQFQSNILPYLYFFRVQRSQ